MTASDLVMENTLLKTENYLLKTKVRAWRIVAEHSGKLLAREQEVNAADDVYLQFDGHGIKLRTLEGDRVGIKTETFNFLVHCRGAIMQHLIEAGVMDNEWKVPQATEQEQQ